MRFFVDGDNRFELVSSEGGWELIVDHSLVHYCRTPLDALKYMSEDLKDESPVEGVAAVVAALDRIDKTMAAATDMIRLQEASARLAKILPLTLSGGSRREYIKYTSLELANLGPGDSRLLAARPDCGQIIGMAKAVLGPWMGEGDEAA